MWQTQAPSRTTFFAWPVALGKILTLDNLKKRHVIVIDKCCICMRNGETVNHLFLLTMWLPLCGVLSLAVLGCLGLCLDGLSTCWPVDGPLEG
jgi:hypothetical protein